MRGVRFFLMMLLFLFLSTSVHAHSLWINVTDYTPENKAPYGILTKIYLGWGHHYPVDDFISEAFLNELSLIEPDGKRTKIEANKGQFMATKLTLKSKGFYYVTASLKPGFYTIYLEGDRIQHRIGPKTGLNNVILSIYYEMYAKALIRADSADDTSFLIPIGQRFEIIPLNDPYKLKVGDYLHVKVLFDGKPARFINVFARYGGFSSEDDFSFATTTDEEGVAKIRITNWGPQLIKAHMRLPSPENLRDKCDMLDYSSTLTFSVL